MLTVRPSPCRSLTSTSRLLRMAWAIEYSAMPGTDDMRLCRDRPLTRSSHPVLSQSRKIVLSSSPEKAATSDMLRPMSLVISERDFGSPSADHWPRWWQSMEFRS